MITHYVAKDKLSHTISSGIITSIKSKAIIHLEKAKAPGLRHVRLKKHRSLPEEGIADFVLTGSGLE